jgi:hypothetical protein
MNAKVKFIWGWVFLIPFVFLMLIAFGGMVYLSGLKDILILMGIYIGVIGSFFLFIRGCKLIQRNWKSRKIKEEEKEYCSF